MKETREYILKHHPHKGLPMSVHKYQKLELKQLLALPRDELTQYVDATTIHCLCSDDLAKEIVECDVHAIAKSKDKEKILQLAYIASQNVPLISTLASLYFSVCQFHFLLD